MPTPSLLIVPARFKSGKMYSQIPTSGAGDFTVTRATSATRVNASGLIESVASGIPRLDYYTSGGTAGCPALLVEPAATNLARWVNQMTAQDTPAASGGMTVTTGSTDFLAPDGTSGSITKYVGGAASGISQYAYYAGGQVTASASGVHTFSLFVKRGATNPLNFCALGIENYTGWSGTIYSNFNLASGTAITAGASIQNYGNGWYRLISAPVTLASTDLSGTLSFFMAEGNGDLSWPASGALNLTAYTWGAQFEAGSIATSYIPTTTAAVTRNADVVSVSGAVSGSIGQTEGTIYLDFSTIVGTNSNVIFALGDSGAGQNRLRILGNTSRELRFIFQLNNNVIQYDFVRTGAVTSLTDFKIAIAYKSGDIAVAINGVLANTSSNALTFNGPLNSVELSAATVGFLTQRYRAADLYTTRLTNDQLAAITQP